MIKQLYKQRIYTTLYWVVYSIIFKWFCYAFPTELNGVMSWCEVYVRTSVWNRKAHMDFRLVYLHLTLANCKGEDQGHTHYDGEYK